MQVENPLGNELAEIAVFGQVAMNNALSTRQLVVATCVSRTSVQWILKNYKYHPYKFQ